MRLVALAVAAAVAVGLVVLSPRPMSAETCETINAIYVNGTQVVPEEQPCSPVP